MENVCLSVDDDSFMYAVGSKAHTDLLDARTLQVRNIRHSYDYKYETYKCINILLISFLLLNMIFILEN